MTDRPDTEDRRKALPPEKWAEVGIAVIKTDGRLISCSCGWMTHHRRPKIRDDKAERHGNKRHGGQVAWL